MQKLLIHFTPSHHFPPSTGVSFHDDDFFQTICSLPPIQPSDVSYFLVSFNLLPKILISENSHRNQSDCFQPENLIPTESYPPAGPCTAVPLGSAWFLPASHSRCFLVMDGTPPCRSTPDAQEPRGCWGLPHAKKGCLCWGGGRF